MRKLRLSKQDARQQFRRMVFNVMARNQDDHTKNIAFTMTRSGRWELSPAFDVTYSHNPAGKWTNMHQMSINGKRDHFSYDDLLTVGNSISIQNPHAIISDVAEAVSEWPEHARTAGVSAHVSHHIATAHRRLVS